MQPMQDLQQVDEPEVAVEEQIPQVDDKRQMSGEEAEQEDLEG